MDNSFWATGLHGARRSKLSNLLIKTKSKKVKHNLSGRDRFRVELLFLFKLMIQSISSWQIRWMTKVISYYPKLSDKEDIARHFVLLVVTLLNSVQKSWTYLQHHPQVAVKSIIVTLRNYPCKNVWKWGVNIKGCVLCNIHWNFMHEISKLKRKPAQKLSQTWF